MGHVVMLNKFNNKFNRIQAPQEIAGFFISAPCEKQVAGAGQNKSIMNLCKTKNFESITNKHNYC